MRQESVFLTEGICYEFLQVATHQRVFTTPLRSDEAVSFLSTMIEMRNITVLSATFRHWKTLSGVLKELHFPSGNLFFDIRTAALMFEHGVSVIYTADADFFQFSELQVINPLSL